MPKAQRRRSYLLSCTLIGAGLCSAALFVGGLTGAVRLEPPLSPLQRAVILALFYGWWGTLPGCLVGLLLNWRTRHRQPPHE